MRLLVTRSYRNRRNDQPEDNSRDTAKDPLARMDSLAGLVVHGRRSSAETDPPWRPEEFLSISGRPSSQSARTLETKLSPEATKMLQTYVAWRAKIRKAHAMPLCVGHTSGFTGFSQSSRVRGGLVPWQKRKFDRYLRTSPTSGTSR
jgi:hypothetical protein